MIEKKDVIVIGAGSAGLYAISEISQKTKNFVLINAGHYGTTCARVGCMPSKAIIKISNTYHQQKSLSKFSTHPIDNSLSIPKVLSHVRELRDKLTQKVISGLARLEKTGRKIDGHATFINEHQVKVGEVIYEADKIIIATGSRPVIPDSYIPFLKHIITTDDFFEQEDLPKNIAVIGLGAIGLELGQSLSRLGLNITGFEIKDSIGGISDPKVNEAIIDKIKGEFPIYTGLAPFIEENKGKLVVNTNGTRIPVDKIIASFGRRPNIDLLGLENMGIKLNLLRIPRFNPNTMQIDGTSIFLAGDATGNRMFLHEAADEGRIAGYNSTHDIQAFVRKTPIRITFSDPNLAVVGKDYSELQLDETIIGECSLAHLGRAIIAGETDGIIRLYADKKTGLLLGAELASPHAENLAHTLAWSISQKLSVIELIKMPFYHPVMEEAIQSALYNIIEQLEKRSDPSPILESHLLNTNS